MYKFKTSKTVEGYVFWNKNIAQH